jgi:hypothetical protein
VGKKDVLEREREKGREKEREKEIDKEKRSIIPREEKKI